MLDNGKLEAHDDCDQLTVDEYLVELDAQLDQADAEHRGLLLAAGSGYAHLRQLHLAGVRLWELRAARCYHRADHDGARKASSTSKEQAMLAAKLEQQSVVDRLAKLEALVKQMRSTGAALEGLA